ncbi:S8 family serine peptidase, partial [Archangium sp.]|uniref:S8 family serine peptidase n=1 Tax=Archangium sp. TaxID=1872627 RepID=UPI002D2B5F01
ILGAASCFAVEAGGRILDSQILEYAGEGDYTGPLVDCGPGDSETSCGPAATHEGFVALVAPGSHSAAETVSHVVRQGARAVILRNADPIAGTGFFTLDAPGAWPPAVSVSRDSGLELQALVGTSVRVSFTGVDYARLSGTSTATPYVSGVAALLWSARPGLTPARVRELLQRSARDLGAPGHDDTFGWGLVQAREALALLAASPP